MPELPKAVDAERIAFSGRAGELSYYVAGEGPPMLLTHSINAAGSVYEVKPVFENYQATRRVYAPDLPGFGFSERSRRHYDARLYTDAVQDMRERIAHECGETPVDALALSLASEFLARAATEAPERFATLALITPTGFTADADRLRQAATSATSAAPTGPPTGTTGRCTPSIPAPCRTSNARRSFWRPTRISWCAPGARTGSPARRESDMTRLANSGLPLAGNTENRAMTNLNVPPLATTIVLLAGSNVFMTFAWYAHLKELNHKPWIIAALISWGIAFFEYLLQVPANRIGYTVANLGQLKILQEVVTLTVFVPFAVFYMREPLRLDFLWAALCLLGAVFFIFRPQFQAIW